MGGGAAGAGAGGAFHHHLPPPPRGAGYTVADIPDTIEEGGPGGEGEGTG